MNRTISPLLAIPFLAAALSSCSRPDCKSNNPVFNMYTPATQEYKVELAKQIKLAGPDKLDYWFENYVERNDTPYLWAHVQGENLCAIAEIYASDWDNDLAGIKRTKGMSYGGAGLIGLEIETKQHSGNTYFVFRGLDYILD